MTLRAVLFDVDFTLAKPGPELMPEGYVRCGERHGLALDASRYEDARDAALVDLKRHPELDHDEEIWVAFTERDRRSAWAATEPASHDVRRRAHEPAGSSTRTSSSTRTCCPCSTSCARRASRSASSRTPRATCATFARHHALEIDAGISSFHHGKTKPHASIFRAVLELLEVEPADAAMVGDTVEDDIEGALALGMRAVLVDRLGLHAGLRAADRRPLRASRPRSAAAPARRL